MNTRQSGHEAPAGQEYLRRAQLLAGSLGRAVEAIAANSVEALEREIEQQTQHCGELAALKRRAAAAGGWHNDGAGSAATVEACGRVHRDTRMLADRYEAVLHHSGQTLRMLRALNQGAVADRDHAGQPGGNSTEGLSWLA